MAVSTFHFTDITESCIKCGKCIPTCTIHQVNSDEVTSPRGFLDLLGAYQRGDLELDKNAKEIFESCFLCTNCVEVCPNSLPTDMVIEQVRNDIRKQYGLAWYKRAFFWLLRHRWMMDWVAKLGYVFQSCGFKINEQNNSMNPRFTMPLVKKERALPKADKTTFLKKYPEYIAGEGKQKVAIFIGCMGNYSYTSIGESLVKVLKRLGVDIFIPKKQLCCGAPAYFTGDFDTVDYLISNNLDYFESWIDEVDAIIIPEATCSAMIAQDWEHFLHDQPEKQERAKKIAEKTYMATDWLYKHTTLLELLGERAKKELRITYHDPCHAKKMQGVFKEPRSLLAHNYELVEMSDSDRCCGFGGVTMQSEKYHFAKAAGLPKAKMIDETGSQVVSAECSACRMQITNSLHQEGSEVVFKNPIELIADALE
jgi:glycolate oxidase iron-sulfur subunit